MKKKYQVFISSTYIDLKEERQAVVEAVLKAGHIPAGMELFKSGKSQLETIKKWIDVSDIYVLILGGRYGSIDEETGKSYTQLEYEYALDKNMPVFAIVINDVLTRQKVKEAEKHEDVVEIYNKAKYDNFKTTVLSKIVAFAGSLLEIKLGVHENIHQFERDYTLKGWVRGDNLNSNEIVALTEENKELKNKLESFQKEERRPKIELEINGENDLIIEYKEIAYEESPKEIKVTDIPLDLKRYIDPNEIMEYNSFFYNTDTLNQYLKESRNYNKIKNNNLELIFEATNNGNIKANNVMIDIKFPKEVLLLKKNDFNKLENPKNSLPKNPLESAKKKQIEDSKSLLERLRDQSLNFNSINNFDYNSMNISNIHQNRLLSLEKENITIKINNLLHTRTIEFIDEDSVYIVPLKKGEYEITVEVICEEFLKKDIFQIPLLIK